VLEAVHTLGAATQFARRLRATQQQHANQGGLGAGEVKDLLQPVLIFGDAAIGAAGRAGQPLLAHVPQCQADGFFVKTRYRLAIVLLIAGIDQSIQRKRIVVGRGDVFFDQRSEHAGFSRIKDDAHGNNVSGIIVAKERVTYACYDATDSTS
jgi:hypothetical protein